MNHNNQKQMKLWIGIAGWEGVRTGTKLALLYAVISPLLWAFFAETPFHFSYIPDSGWLMIIASVSIGGVPPGAVIGGITGALMGCFTLMFHLENRHWQRLIIAMVISTLMVGLLHMTFGKGFLDAPFPSQTGYLLGFAIPSTFYLLGTVWFSINIPTFITAYPYK